MIDTTWDLVHITVTFGFWERHLFPDRAPYRATEIVFHKSGQRHCSGDSGGPLDGEEELDDKDL